MNAPKMRGRISLADQWKSYLQRVVPITASRSQIIETRRAFYAGALAYTHIVNTSLDSGSNDATEADMQLLQSLEGELRDFYAKVSRNEDTDV